MGYDADLVALAKEQWGKLLTDFEAIRAPDSFPISYMPMPDHRIFSIETAVRNAELLLFEIPLILGVTKEEYDNKRCEAYLYAAAREWDLMQSMLEEEDRSPELLEAEAALMRTFAEEEGRDPMPEEEVSAQAAHMALVAFETSIKRTRLPKAEALRRIGVTEAELEAFERDHTRDSGFRPGYDEDDMPFGPS